MLQTVTTSRVRFIECDPSSALDVLGITLFPLVSNGESNDQFGLFHALIPPGVGIPLHSHPDVELFYLLEGELKSSSMAPVSQPAKIRAGSFRRMRCMVF